MELRFHGELVHWRGPAPYHFVGVPEEESHQLRVASPRVSYGWGVIPVTARIGATEWTTSLFPRSGRYLVPIKTWVREAEDLELGDDVAIRLRVDL